MSGANVKRFAKSYMPSPLLEPARRCMKYLRTRSNRVPWHAMRRLQPISSHFFERGNAIDRYYIEQFLDRNRQDVRGRVLEVADPSYTRQFGDDRVTQSDVLHAVAGNPEATIIGNLETGQNIPSDAFDCIILTQTLQLIYDVHSVVKTLHRALKPGGVALVTVPGIAQLARGDYDRWGDHWRFTTLSAPRLFEEAFEKDRIQVQAYGNVLTAIGYLHRLAVSDFTTRELEYRDFDYEVIISIRAQKAPAA